jgi:hypothetical protein
LAEFVKSLSEKEEKHSSEALNLVGATPEQGWITLLCVAIISQPREGSWKIAMPSSASRLNGFLPSILNLTSLKEIIT